MLCNMSSSKIWFFIVFTTITMYEIDFVKSHETLPHSVILSWYLVEILILILSESVQRVRLWTGFEIIDRFTRSLNAFITSYDLTIYVDIHSYLSKRELQQISKFTHFINPKTNCKRDRDEIYASSASEKKFRYLSKVGIKQNQMISPRIKYLLFCILSPFQTNACKF